jgi:hypothetical protein
MSISNQRKRLAIVFFVFIGTMFSDGTLVFGKRYSFPYSGFRYHSRHKIKRKNKNSDKCILCGTSLEKAYANLIALSYNELRSLSASEIIEYSKNAHDKKMGERNLEERIAFRLVTSATKNLAKRIVNKYLNANDKNSTVLVFGGILQGGGDFLEKLLLQQIDDFNDSKRDIRVVFSKLGDERAILGAVKHAESKLNSCKGLKGQYAIGLDIGGTNIRAGLVDLEKHSLIGELVKQPVFINNDDKNRLYSFKSQIKSVSKANKKNKNCEINELCWFLKDKASQVEHELLTDLVINRICDLIKELEKDLNIKFVAISSAGTINENGFCLCAYNLPFTCVDIKQRVESIINIPVFVANDMYCAALGEKNFGALKSVNEFTIIGLGTGLGFKKFN